MSKSCTDNNAKRNKNNKTKPNSNILISKLKYSKMMRGELYEKISSIKIYKDFFLEDFNHPSRQITANCEINFGELRSQIATYLIIDPNPVYKEYMNEIYELKKKIENCLITFLEKHDQIDSDLSSDSDKNTISDEGSVERKKTLKSIEMDYVVKKIEGKKLIDCFTNLGERHKQLIKSFDINTNEFYNICFEMTINNEDIKNHKIFQLYKYAAWITLLCGITNLILSAKPIVQGAFTQILNKISEKYRFLEYKKKTILILVCNGRKDKFEQIEEMFKDCDKSKEVKYLKELKDECKGKYNLYCEYYPFLYEDESDKNNNEALYEKEKEERENDKKKYIKEKEVYDNKINELKKNLGQKEQQIIQYKEQLEKELEKYENQLKEVKNEYIKEKEKLQSQISEDTKIINEMVKEINKDKENYVKRIEDGQKEFAKEREKYEKKIEDGQKEFAKEREKYEKKIEDGQKEFAKEKEKYEKKIEDAQKEIEKEKEKYEKKIEDAQKEIEKERDNNRKSNETLINYLNEKYADKIRITKLESLLKENKIQFD